MFASLFTIFKKINLTAHRFVILLAAAVFTPLLAMSLFDHPSADDFCFPYVVSQTGYWGAQVRYYMTWTGRYASTALISLFTNQPGWIFADRFLAITLLVFTFLSLMLFFKLLLTAWSGTKERNWPTAAALGAVVLVAQVLRIPSLTQGFYWASGALTYQVSFFLLVLELTLFLLLFHESRNVRIAVTVLLAIDNLVLIGFNEVAMFTAVLLNALVFAIALQAKKYRLSLGVSFLSSLAAAAAVIGAPGNKVRTATNTYGMRLFSVALNGSLRAMNTIFSLLGSAEFWLLLVVFVLLLPRPSGKAGALRIRDSHLWLIGIFSVVIVGMGTTLPLLSVNYLPYRTINLLIEIFIVGCALIAGGLFYSWPELLAWREAIYKSSVSRLVLFGLLLATIAFSTNQISLAWFDLMKGTAVRYDREQMARYRQIEQAQQAHAESLDLEPFENKPELISFEDIGSNDTDWSNICFEGYFKIPKVRIRSR